MKKSTLFCLLVLISPAWQLFSSNDVSSFQDQVSVDFADGVNTLAMDLLRTDEVEELFSAQFKTQAFGGNDFDSMLSTLVLGVQSRFDLAKQAVQDVQSKLLTYFTGPTLPRSGPPRLVPSCCKLFAPGELTYHGKLRLDVDSDHHCYARDKVSAGQGFDLWADDALDAMKSNFESVPSILWQEVGTKDGLHVQFPTRKRSCDNNGNSNAKILRQWYREKFLRPPLNLVIILDASDEMLDVVVHSNPPVTHWNIIKKAAIDVLGTLLPKDRVTIITTGHHLSTPSSCNSSLFVNTEQNINVLKMFVDTITPAGSPDYPEVVKEGFRLLASQENIDKAAYQGLQEATNVMLFMTNAETPILGAAELFQAVADGQSKLISKAHIQVYALRTLLTQAAFNSFLRLADQNNGVVIASNGTGDVTAPSWATEGFTQPLGPAGYLMSIPDTEEFGFSEDVIQFAGKLRLGGAGMVPPDLVLDPVEMSEEGPILHAVAPVATAVGNIYGLFATNMSVESLLGDIIGFFHQTDSYVFVAERGTGHVLAHPKIATQSDVNGAFVSLPTLENLEPSLTADQMKDIMLSDDSNKFFQAKVTAGRELYKSGSNVAGSLEDVNIGHRLVKGTNFIVALVVFQSEMVTRIPQQLQAPGTPGPAVYHRFDLLPPTVPRCVTSGTFALDKKFGVMLSPNLFADSHAYRFQTMAPADVLELNNYVGSPASLADLTFRGSKLLALLNLEHAGSGADDLLIDLNAMNSDVLKDVWINTETTSQERFIGTLSGILLTMPAMAFPSTMDHKQYPWFLQAVASPGDVIITRTKFPGTTRNFIVSKAVVSNQRLTGVTGATVNAEILKALVWNKVSLCSLNDYSCELMDKNGYLMEINPTPIPPRSSHPHVTEVYPWLANVFIINSLMKPIWCTDFMSSQNQRNYVISVPASGVSSKGLTPSVTDDCRKFTLHPVSGTNILILALTKRTPGKCPPENYSPMESCSLSPAPPPPPGQPLPSLPQCKSCVSGISQPGTQPCQPPCYCDVELEVCSGHYKPPTPGWTWVPCYEEPADSPSDAVKPSLPGPMESKCPKQCSEMFSKIDCETSSPECKWDDSRPYPVCIHTVRTTTTSTTSTTTTTTTTPVSTSSVTSSTSKVTSTATQVTSIKLPPTTGTTTPVTTSAPGTSATMITAHAAAMAFTTVATSFPAGNHLAIASPMRDVKDKDSTSDNAAAIAGGTTAGIILLAVAAFLIYKLVTADWLAKKRRISGSRSEQNSEVDLIGNEAGQTPREAWSGNDGSDATISAAQTIHDIGVNVPPSNIVI